MFLKKQENGIFVEQAIIHKWCNICVRRAPI